jgi:hypothetical protein
MSSACLVQLNGWERTKNAMLHKLVLCPSLFKREDLIWNFCCYSALVSRSAVLLFVPLSCLLPCMSFRTVRLIWSKELSPPHLSEFPRSTAMVTIRLGTIITFGLGRLYPCLSHCPLCSRETERNGVRRRSDVSVGAVLCSECSANACSINL